MPFLEVIKLYQLQHLFSNTQHPILKSRVDLLTAAMLLLHEKAAEMTGWQCQHTKDYSEFSLEKIFYSLYDSLLNQSISVLILIKLDEHLFYFTVNSKNTWVNLEKLSMTWLYYLKQKSCMSIKLYNREGKTNDVVQEYQ